MGVKDILKSIPSSPGVYKMKDSEGRVIYVGKAKNLAKRVSNYFRKDYAHSYRTGMMVSQIDSVECVQTDNELEALILENNLIKQLKPKYNILMKDDKSYVYIKIDTREDFPQVKVLREHTLEHTGVERNPVKYFGPKLASSHVYDTLHILKKILPFRHCNLNIEWKGTEKDPATLGLAPDPEAVSVTNRVIDFPCLDYHIKRCPGPCIGAVSPEEYKKTIQSLIEFFSGKSDILIENIQGQMKEAAQKKDFEKAARLRDALLSIEALMEKQKISDPRRIDTDVIHGTASMGHLYYSILIIRKGKIIDQSQFVFDALESKEGTDEITALNEMEYFEAFVKQYYERTNDIPKEIIIPRELEDFEVLEAWLAQVRGDKVTITHPQKGEKNQLLDLALKNATTFAKQHRIKWLAAAQHEEATKRLAEALSFTNNSLKRIEGFDISHLGGNDTVASMVVFENGKAKSSDYRHFKLRTVVGKPDDFKSMEEVLTRRFKYLAMKNQKAGLRVAKATKKDALEIGCAPANYCVAKIDKKIVGHTAIEKLQPTVSVITSLSLDPEVSQELIGFTLLEKAIKSHKQKKIYICVEQKWRDFFAAFGAVALIKIPDALTTYITEKNITDPLLMVYEVTKRKKVDPSFSATPDLVLIDGGKGQLAVAVRVLKKLHLPIPVVSLAKKLEEIFIPGASAPVLLENGNEALRLLQHVRDESHRFAITFQRDLHVKAMYH